MAKFEPALAKTLAHEGGFSNDSLDPGGMTYCGISRKAWPKWAGWVAIDGMLTHGARILPGDPTLRPQVIDFYRVNFWLPLHGYEIESQEIAEYLFDFAVNSGISDAVKALQRVLREVHDGAFKVDGIFGDKTLSAVNKYPTLEVDLLRTYRLAHYLETIADNPKLARFARGFARRALA